MKPWMIPTRYAHEEREREKRQDDVMAAAGWIKVRDGMWTNPEPTSPLPPSQSETP